MRSKWCVLHACVNCVKAAGAAVPERSADRQLALGDIIEPELVDHGVSVVIGEGPTIGQEGRGEQAIAH